MKYRSVLDEIKRIRKDPIKRIYVIGGGVKNALLCQFTANATGLPVFAGPAEAAAIGNIMTQAYARECVLSLEHMREVIRNSCKVVTYEPIQTAEWEEAFGRFQEIVAREPKNGKNTKD